MQTLDIDYRKYFKTHRLETAPKIPIKIVNFCKKVKKIETETSPGLNGTHIKLYGCGNCDLCRLVFDDQTRFALDLNIRPPAERNVLWNKKTIIKKGFKPLTFKK